MKVLILETLFGKSLRLLGENPNCILQEIKGSWCFVHLKFRFLKVLGYEKVHIFRMIQILGLLWGNTLNFYLVRVYSLKFNSVPNFKNLRLTVLEEPISVCQSVDFEFVFRLTIYITKLLKTDYSSNITKLRYTLHNK